MNIESIIFFDMALAIFILSVALIAIVTCLVNIIKRGHQGTQSTEDETLKKNEELLDDTRKKAVKMIDEANSRALDIVNKVTLSTDIASEDFKEDLSRVSSAQIREFEKATSDFTKLYSQILQDLKTKNIEVFQNVSKDIETNTMKEIGNFKESMQKLTIFSQKEVKQKMDIDYIASRKAIEDYKKEEFKKIDQEIYEILEKISKIVLNKALNLSEHEDLITKSLEQAKKEGAFKQSQ